MERTFAEKLEKVNSIFTVVFWISMSFISLISMYYVASRKTIVISDTKNDSIEIAAGNSEAENNGSYNKLLLNNLKGMPGEFGIPLEKGIKAENVVIENCYTEEELRIYIKGADVEFYAGNAVFGDITFISQGECEHIKDGVILTFKMDGVYEYHTTMNDDIMTVSYEKPDEIYKMVVVIDPMGGGSENGNMLRGYAEKTLALQVAEKIPEKISNQDICVFLTRTDDVDVSEKERIAFVNDCGADLYIRIGVSNDHDENAYGISAIYNEEYFIPEFGNVELADALTRNVTIASGNRAVGLMPADKESILSYLTIPAAQVNVGYFTNTKEAVLLSKDEYREKLAQGIADAIAEVYTTSAE